MVWEVGIGARNRFAGRQILGLTDVSIRCQNLFGVAGRLAGLERGKALRDLARSGDRYMDIVGLEDAAHVGFVRLALAQALDCRLLVAEGR
jgi:hypothetical protein